MADVYFSEEEVYASQVRMVANGDPVDGGPDGPVNKALKALVNRTASLKKQVADINNKEIGTASLANKAVTAEKMADGAVITEVIEDGAVTTEKMADASITGDKIAKNAITADNIDLNDLQNALTEESDGGISFMVAGIAAAPNYYAEPVKIFLEIGLLWYFSMWLKIL